MKETYLVAHSIRSNNAAPPWCQWPPTCSLLDHSVPWFSQSQTQSTHLRKSNRIGAPLWEITSFQISVYLKLVFDYILMNQVEVTKCIQSSMAGAHAYSTAGKVQGCHRGPLLGHWVISFCAVKNHGILLPWNRIKLVSLKTVAAFLIRWTELSHLPPRISSLPALPPPTHYEPGEWRTRWSSTGWRCRSAPRSSVPGCHSNGRPAAECILLLHKHREGWCGFSYIT